MVSFYCRKYAFTARVNLSKSQVLLTITLPYLFVKQWSVNKTNNLMCRVKERQSSKYCVSLCKKKWISKMNKQSDNSTDNSLDKRPKLKESNDPMDLIRMQTEVGLFESMAQSKTLTIIVILAVVFFGGFFFFLYKMAGAA